MDMTAFIPREVHATYAKLGQVHWLRPRWYGGEWMYTPDILEWNKAMRQMTEDEQRIATGMLRDIITNQQGALWARASMRLRRQSRLAQSFSHHQPRFVSCWSK